MPKRIVDLRSQRPILDIASYGRRGPGHHPALTSSEIAHASRTARGVPEVVVRVTGGARTVRGVGRTLDYIGQEGNGYVETDEGTVLHEEGFEKHLLKDWNLEVEAGRRHTQRAVARERRPPKLVHNLVFSMRQGTPSDKLLQAVRKFTTEKFALQHRYAMALHTHQGNPHVHVVVKAVSERGERLNIRKATLREWRQDFARYLREFGVEANATERAVRGSTFRNQKNGIFWAARRGDSSFLRGRVASVARELPNGSPHREPGRHRLLATRREVDRGWRGFADAAAGEGMHDVAAQVRRFVDRMPPAWTDRERIAEHLRAGVRERAPPSVH